MTEVHPCDYAFPVAPGDVPYWQPGMSTLQWYAGQALPGVIETCARDTLKGEETREQLFARKAFAVARAMMDEARKQ